MTTDRYDVAIVGGGPNGLTAAAYLARAGARVVVLESRFERGGTLATDDYSTPFQYNQAQLLLPVGAAEMPPVADLGLTGHAVAFLEPEVAFSAGTGADALAVGRGGTGLGDDVQALLREASSVVAPWLYRPSDEAARALGDGAVRLAAMSPDELVRTASDEQGALVLRYACWLAGFTDGAGALGPIGAFCVARLFEPVLVAGGSKSLANGLFRAAARAGARCLVSTPVAAVESSDRDVEVRLADARRFRVRAVVSTLDPVSTFLGLVGRERCGEELAAAADRWEFDAAGPFTAHFGIRGEAPAPVATTRERHGSGADGDAAIRLVGFDTEQDVVATVAAAATGSVPARPGGHLTVTSHHDPLQASPGPYGPLHTLRFQTPAPYEHPDGAWDHVRVAYREACWRLLEDEVDGLSETQLLFGFCDSPSDLERRFGTTRRGSIRQGALQPAQTFTARPDPSCADGRTPLPGLYVGGGSIHPGVPGSLGGGYNVASAVCADLGFDRWWPVV